MSRRKKLLFATGAAVLCVVLILGLGECFARVYCRDELNLVPDERTLCYRYDAELGWFPIENSSNEFEATRLIHIQNNADGFRDRPHGPKTKKRIAFVGDSYVWGYDVEQNERFTEKLQRLLPDWEVLNLGVSGYGNDQELILLQKWFARYQPDVVFLEFCDNDMVEDRLNLIHGGYYKPYFDEVDHQLVERGVPVPKSIRYYRLEHPLLFKSALVQALVNRYMAWRAPEHFRVQNFAWPLLARIKGYVESRGAKFAIGFVSDWRGEKKRSFCEASGIDYLFLLGNPPHLQEYVYPEHGNHWTPKGHDRVCQRLFGFLTTHHLIDPEPGQSGR